MMDARLTSSSVRRRSRSSRSSILFARLGLTPAASLSRAPGQSWFELLTSSAISDLCPSPAIRVSSPGFFAGN
jgi:hypothetical protein